MASHRTKSGRFVAFLVGIGVVVLNILPAACTRAKTEPDQRAADPIQPSASRSTEEAVAKSNLDRTFRTQRADAERVLSSATPARIAMAAMHLNGTSSGDPTEDVVKVLDAAETVVKVERMQAIMRDCSSGKTCADLMDAYKNGLERCVQAGGEGPPCAAHHDAIREVLLKYGKAALGAGKR